MLVKAYSEEDKDLINPPQIVSTGNQSNTTGYHIRMGIDTTFVSGQGETATPMIRYAEALLAYAEAAEELGKCDAAVLEKTIKPLRERAGVTYLAPSAIDPNFPDLVIQFLPICKKSVGKDALNCHCRECVWMI